MLFKMAFVQETKGFECWKEQQLPAVMLGLTKKACFWKNFSVTLNVRELCEMIFLNF